MMSTSATRPAHPAGSDRTPDVRYRLIGRPESGYSIKVRSALRYKGVEFEWLDRFRHGRLYRRHARVQLIPLVLLPDGSAMQDSTPILEYLEERHPSPSIHPPDPALEFLSRVMEEYGDEWANKLMFYYRWSYPADQEHRSQSLAAGIIEGAGLGLLQPLFLPIGKRLLIRRMVERMAFAGANANNAPLLIESFSNLVDMLDVHLAGRRYLFGGRPAFGDFGLWGQLHQAWSDPSSGAILSRRGPNVVRWLERMEHPSSEGEFESLSALEPTLRPIFAREVARHFLAWSDANAKAFAGGEPRTELQMDGRLYHQKTFKYPARTLKGLRESFHAVRDSRELRDFLEVTGCLAYLEVGR